MYLKRYFSELEPFSLILVKIGLFLNYITILATLLFIITTHINIEYLVYTFFDNTLLKNIYIALASIFYIVITEILLVLSRINIYKYFKNLEFKYQFLYKVVFGQEYVITMLIIIVISIKLLNIIYTLAIMLIAIITVWTNIKELKVFLYLLSIIILLYQLVIITNVNIESHILIGSMVIIAIAYIYNSIYKKVTVEKDRNAQLMVLKSITKSRHFKLIDIPIMAVVLQYLAMVIPRIFSIPFTDIQLIGYINIVTVLLIIITQIKNPILINLDWYANFVKYVFKLKNNSYILIHVLERNNLIVILSITSLIFVESIFIYNVWCWWLIPLMLLLWYIDNAFTYYSFKFLSVSQRENLRQHTNKQLPYVCFIGISILLLTSVVNLNIRNIKITLVLIVTYLLLFGLTSLLKREGKENFKRRIEENFNE